VQQTGVEKASRGDWLGARAAGFACKISANLLAAQSSGKIMSVGRPPGLFVRYATQDCSCASVDIDVLEEGRDLAERGGGKRFVARGFSCWGRVFDGR
jgi:hypothetical protein